MGVDLVELMPLEVGATSVKPGSKSENVCEAVFGTTTVTRRIFGTLFLLNFTLLSVGLGLDGHHRYYFLW